ncbi:MAG: transcriptional regulator [Geminicoccaceae bacterium]
MMDKRTRAAIFQERLAEAAAAAGLSLAGLARTSGVDRSTLGQLLKPGETRLPNAHTTAELAAVLDVSTDWLLGLTAHKQSVATILEASLEVAHRSQTPSDENLTRWYKEAIGFKIRHVPVTLPDLLKTEDVLAFEYAVYLGKTVEQAINTAQTRVDYARLPDTDIEICMPRQALEEFSRGNGVWEGLSSEVRRQQMAHLAELCNELYPSLRLYLYDARKVYAASYTVFGQQRAALYLGQSFFVFSTERHIRMLIQHFDELVRRADSSARDVADFGRGLRT